MIFCRKTAEKKNLFHFQFPSQRFPHGCDVGLSFRNAQVTHAGTPRGGAQEFLGGGGLARGGAPASCAPCRPPGSPRTPRARRRHVTGKSLHGNPRGSRGKTEREKRELAVGSLCGGPSARRSAPRGRSSKSGREKRRRRRRARSTPPAGPANERARSPGVHGVPPPPDLESHLRCSPALTWTWDFGRGSRGPERCCGTPRWLNNSFLRHCT